MEYNFQKQQEVNPSGVVDREIFIDPRCVTRAIGSRHRRCQIDLYPCPASGRYLSIALVSQISVHRYVQADMLKVYNDEFRCNVEKPGSLTTLGRSD